MLLGLKSRIGTAFPLQEDSFLKKRALPASFQTLAIAALWGGTVSLSSSKFKTDLLHVGLCSVKKIDDENLYILDEELGRQAILDFAEKTYVVEEKFASVLRLCRPAAGHAMEPLLIAELRAWCKRNEDATVFQFISSLFSKLPTDLPVWINTAKFNVASACNKEGCESRCFKDDIAFVSDAITNGANRNCLLSPSIVKRPDFEAVMESDSLWFLSISSKLYAKTFDDLFGNDLRSTSPSFSIARRMGVRMITVVFYVHAGTAF
jgi:hypothetical protein